MNNVVVDMKFKMVGNFLSYFDDEDERDFEEYFAEVKFIVIYFVRKNGL